MKFSMDFVRTFNEPKPRAFKLLRSIFRSRVGLYGKVRDRMKTIKHACFESIPFLRKGRVLRTAQPPWHFIFLCSKAC